MSGADRRRLWAGTAAEDWERDRLWLAVLPRQVRIINPAGVAGNNTRLRPRNNPLDNYDEILERAPVGG